MGTAPPHRPFQGRDPFVRPVPGALPPATEFIRCGDCHEPRGQPEMWVEIRANRAEGCGYDSKVRLFQPSVLRPCLFEKGMSGSASPGSDRIGDDVKLRALPYLGLALFIGGCPKRQAPVRIVYVPAPPPAATQAPAAGAPALVIEEPPPPEPPPAPPPPTPAPKPVRQRRRARTEPPAAAPSNAPDTTGPPAPSLEPQENSVEEAALRRQIQGLQDDVRQRIAKLSRARLSGADRKTLDDARAFFAQSTQALKEADLQRALNLARKASLLVTALER